MKLFRSMRESQDGLPELGPHARKLGVRPGVATTPDVQAIQPDDIVTFGEGMSKACQLHQTIQRTFKGIVDHLVLEEQVEIQYGTLTRSISVARLVFTKIGQVMES